MHLVHRGTPEQALALGAEGDTDDVLAARCRDDLQVFAVLYVRHRDAVLGYLRARTAEEDDALELTAATFERALLAVARYQPRGAGFRAWLFRIARNAAIDDGRRRKRQMGAWVRPAVPDGDDLADLRIVDPSPRPDEAAVVADERRRLRSALALLPEPQRDALGLRYGAGLTAREIGAVIDKREAAVQKLIERATDRLREVLA